MANFDWGRFSVRINVKVPIEKLYWCWATKEGIEYWFLRKSEYKKPDGSLYAPGESVQKGDGYSWWWHGYSDDVVEHGEILDCNGKDLFQFRFGDAGICTVRIYDEQDEQIVELVQTDIPTDEKGKQNWHIGCKTGWTFYMANLKSMLEGGVDLRNRNEKIQNVITA
ncbi:MAG TPA: SRPBCC domain-containing protein [Chitinophagaceae bacterium]|nr:SRPBCC domain-containing protein [Chitinophagaceae bacterium]MCB9054937.1 SRPBCC domain-containing protein [Chitinophagales bacterium]HPG12098.1 SRPBCC domain-containing protein [Chitinophagaceae bacterium]